MRYDLTDFEWSLIEPLLPKDRRGVKPKNNRQFSTAYSGFCARARRGAIFPNDTGPILRPTIASIGGERPASGTA